MVNNNQKSLFSFDTSRIESLILGLPFIIAFLAITIITSNQSVQSDISASEEEILKPKIYILNQEEFDNLKSISPMEVKDYFSDIPIREIEKEKLIKRFNFHGLAIEEFENNGELFYMVTI